MNRPGKASGRAFRHGHTGGVSDRVAGAIRLPVPPRSLKVNRVHQGAGGGVPGGWAGFYAGRPTCSSPPWEPQTGEVDGNPGA